MTTSSTATDRIERTAEPSANDLASNSSADPSPPTTPAPTTRTAPEPPATPPPPTGSAPGSSVLSNRKHSPGNRKWLTGFFSRSAVKSETSEDTPTAETATTAFKNGVKDLLASEPVVKGLVDLGAQHITDAYSHRDAATINADQLKTKLDASELQVATVEANLKTVQTKHDTCKRKREEENEEWAGAERQNWNRENTFSALSELLTGEDARKTSARTVIVVYDNGIGYYKKLPTPPTNFTARRKVQIAGRPRNTTTPRSH